MLSRQRAQEPFQSQESPGAWAGLWEGSWESLGMGSRVLPGLLGAGIGCREPELSHRPLLAAVLWEQPEVAQQRFGKVSPEWSPRSLAAGHFAAQPCGSDRKSLGCHTQRGVLLSPSLRLLSIPDIPNPCGTCCSRSAEHR